MINFIETLDFRKQGGLEFFFSLSGPMGQTFGVYVPVKGLITRRIFSNLFLTLFNLYFLILFCEDRYKLQGFNIYLWNDNPSATTQSLGLLKKKPKSPKKANFGQIKPHILYQNSSFPYSLSTLSLISRRKQQETTRESTTTAARNET